MPLKNRIIEFYSFIRKKNFGDGIAKFSTLFLLFYGNPSRVVAVNPAKNNIAVHLFGGFRQVFITKPRVAEISAGVSEC